MFVHVLKYCSVSEYDNMYPFEIDVFNAVSQAYEEELTEQNIINQTAQMATHA